MLNISIEKITEEKIKLSKLADSFNMLNKIFPIKKNVEELKEMFNEYIKKSNLKVILLNEKVDLLSVKDIIIDSNVTLINKSENYCLFRFICKTDKEDYNLDIYTDLNELNGYHISIKEKLSHNFDENIFYKMIKIQAIARRFTNVFEGSEITNNKLEINNSCVLARSDEGTYLTTDDYSFVLKDSETEVHKKSDEFVDMPKYLNENFKASLKR